MKKPNSKEQALTWNDRLSVYEFRQRRVTFGKYINVQIQHLPDDYLEWAVLNIKDEWGDYFLREWKHRNPVWKKLIKTYA